MLNAIYNVTINKFGVNTNVGYKINTSNKDKYSFGNRFLSGILAYYSLQSKKTNFTPNVGLSYEHTATNTLQSQKVTLTGGYLSLVTTGIEVGFKRFNIGGNIQLPEP